MLHFRMISSSDINGVVEGNSNKPPIGNGCCSSSGVSLKYKRRRVSAVRDFPPGCGREAQVINQRTQEAVAVRHEVNLEVNGEKVANTVEGDRVNAIDAVAQSGEALNTSVQPELSGLLDDLVDRVVTAAMEVDGVGALSTNLGSMELELPKVLEDGVQESLKEETDGVEKQALGKSVDVTENKTMLEAGALSPKVVPEAHAQPPSPPECPPSDGKALKETVLKDKFTRRRVSAVRDFPPFCGRNAPCASEEDRLRLFSKFKNLDDKDIAAAEVTSRVKGKEPEKDAQEGNAQKKEVKRADPEPQKRKQTVANKDNEASRVKGKEPEKDAQEGNAQKKEVKGADPEPRKRKQTVANKDSEDVRSSEGKVGKEIVISSHAKILMGSPSDDRDGLGSEIDRFVVQGLMAAPKCPWRRMKGALVTSKVGCSSGGKVKQHALTMQQKSNLATRMDAKAESSKGKSVKRNLTPTKMEAYEGASEMIIMEEESSVAQGEEQPEKSDAVQSRQNFDISLPPFGPNSSSHGDVRNKVRETLRLFQAICRKLLQGEEAKLRTGEGGKSKQQEKQLKRIDLSAAKIIREKGKEVNTEKQRIGAVPGVEVGDEFQFRVELALIGVHRLYQAGIDYMKMDGVIVATSIVASGGYHDDMDNADVLIYSGQGGIGRDKQPEDQKLERGNLALKNSISAGNPVRVIRGSRETKASDSSNTRSKLSITYTYDGLYTVKRYWHEPGLSGKIVFKFELRRNPGQKELAWKEVKKSKKFKVREGLCVDDISGGKEFFPICAVNTIDNEKPPVFTYITKIMYPDWYRPVPIQSCDCIGGCSDSPKCLCVVKNGGEIPYNHNGAIVEVKSLVYECGPSCKCPPSCYNRVSQHGIKKIQLEIFKTESRGWGVRSLNSIPAGTFMCEYVGELLEDKDAEKRTGNDEYLFDIGQNYNDCSVIDVTSTLKPDAEDSGFTIDAAHYGNVGRFINHSCSPNLYAQNVLYDHDDKRMPHIMFFAAENIPPLQELTYHYNYSMDQIRDSNGNIRKKSCYCGAPDCTGRMY